LVAIVNITNFDEPFDICTYSLRINQRELCQFTHKREYGLASCLKAAAKAVEDELKPFHYSGNS